MLRQIIKDVIEKGDVNPLGPNESGWAVEVSTETWHTAIRGFSDWLSDKVASSLGNALKDEPLYCRLITKEEAAPRITKYCFLFKASKYRKNNE